MTLDVAERLLAGDFDPLLDELADLDAVARQARLRSLEADHPGVAAALRAAIDEDRWPVPSDASCTVGVNLQAGSSVGPWRLVERIAEGGMGEVWRADGDNAPPAAIKIIPTGLRSSSAVARFERERDVLARLDHPHIARLYDSGVTESGCPWIAMELLVGESITDYATERNLATDQRIELLLPVCDALAQAHRDGVVHRDVKPVNIVVESRSNPRSVLVDFGISALTDATHLTRSGEIFGTPIYMSPEQARGDHDRVDARTDVYGIGATLYELVTDRAPFSGKDAAAVIYQVIHRPPPRLDGAAADGRLQLVIDRCLEKRPMDRYESMQGLGQDLRALVEGGRIAASKGARRRGLMRIVRSAPAALKAACAATAAALATAVLVWAMARLQQDEMLTTPQQSVAILPITVSPELRDMTWFELGISQAVSELLQQASGLRLALADERHRFTGMTPKEVAHSVGSDYAVRAAVDPGPGRYLLRYELYDARDDAQTKGEVSSAEPAVLARLFADQIAGEIHGQPLPTVADNPLFDDRLAFELYARAAQAVYADDRDSAQALLAAALTRAPGNVVLRTMLINASLDWGDVGKTIEAYRRLLDEVPDAAAKERLRVLERLANLLWHAGEIEASRAVVEDALLLARGGGVNDPYLLANTLNDLAITLQSQGEVAPARRAAEEALQIFESLGDDFHTALVASNLGYLAEDAGDLSRAREHHQRALRISQRYGFEDLQASYAYALARIHRRRGELEPALSLLQGSLAVARRLGEKLDEFDYLEEIAEVEMRRGEFAAAESTLAQAREVAEASDDRIGLAWHQDVLGRLRSRQGRLDESIELLTRSARTQETLGEKMGAATTRIALARIQLLEERPEEASRTLAAMEDSVIEGNVRFSYDLAVELVKVRLDPTADPAPMKAALDRARDAGAVDIEAEYAIDFATMLAATQPDIARALRVRAARWNRKYYRLDSEQDRL